MCKYEYLHVDVSCTGTRDYNYYNDLLGEHEESVPARLSGSSEDTGGGRADSPAGNELNQAHRDEMAAATLENASSARRTSKKSRI